MIERWELLQAQSSGPHEARRLTSVLDDVASWLEKVTPELERLQQSDPAAGIEELAARATELKVGRETGCNRSDAEYSAVVFTFTGIVSQEMQRTFTRYKSIMLSVNLRPQEATEQRERLAGVNRAWSRARAGLSHWDSRLRGTLTRCQVRRNSS